MSRVKKKKKKEKELQNKQTKKRKRKHGGWAGVLGHRSGHIEVKGTPVSVGVFSGISSEKK